MPTLIGQTLLNRYQVLEPIGRGGMAEVYKVYDQKRAVHLALKLLHEDLAQDRVFLRRFQREAQTLAKLQHPNIVRFYGFEQDGRQSFLLMDYVEGESLRSEIFDLDGKPMALPRVWEIMQSVCSALHYAHTMSLVHCDLKPGNVMLHRNGTILVADFGIARMTDAATATMVGAGTPAYMAPEQIKGADPTPQTDIYALGVVLFEMLTGGERPFTGERSTVTGTTGEKVRWEHLNLNPPSPGKWNSAITPALEEIVLKCLRKDPGERFCSALEMQGAIETEIVHADASARKGVSPSGVQPEEQKPQAQEIHQKPPSPVTGSMVGPGYSPPRRVGRLSIVPVWAWVIIACLSIALVWSLLQGVLGGRDAPVVAAIETVRSPVTELAPVNSNTNMLSSGSSVQGRTTTSSGDRWQLQLQAGDVVELSMRALDGLDTYLELINPQGRSLETDDDGGEGSDSYIVRLIFETGVYTVVARGFDGAVGDYALSVEELQGTFQGSVTPGRNGTRTLTESTPIHTWAYEGRSGETLSLSMEGMNGFDTYLELLSPTGERVAYDDDGGEGRNSLLQAGLAQSGAYTIIARGCSYHLGSYELSLGSSGGSSPSNTLFIGSAVRDDVTNSSGDSWPLNVNAGDIVAITMDEVGDLDTYLELLDPHGNLLANNDDGGSGRNSRLLAVIRQTGTYTVIARGYNGGEGEYILAVENASNALEGTLSRGQPVLRTLTGAEPEHVWLYEGHAGESISISMEGVDGIDAFLEMYGPGGERIGRNDDGGEGFNALLEVELNQSGIYAIIARDLGGRAGSYELMIQ
ncbi:MAG: protein kinase [Anaerolineales bacterium]|nr:protein kinase [Anaerolineales bacterium]